MTSAAATATTTTATAPDIETLIADYVAAWGARDADRIAAYHADDGIFHLHSHAEPVRGREAIRETFAGLLTVFPDLTFVEQELISGEWGWVVMITVADGKLTAKHTYLDWDAALAQLGLE